MHGAILERDHVRLAGLCLEAVLAVVVEERVQAGTVDEDVLGVGRPNTPSALAIPGGVASARGLEIRVVELVVDFERLGRDGVALEVRSLGLDQREVDV